MREITASAVFSIQEAVGSDGVVELSLVGELDIAAAPGLERRLGELRAKLRAVRIDLSRVEFMDSSGLRALINAWNHGQESKWHVELDPNLSPQVERFLMLTGTGQILEDGVQR